MQNELEASSCLLGGVQSALTTTSQVGRMAPGEGVNLARTHWSGWGEGGGKLSPCLSGLKPCPACLRKPKAIMFSIPSLGWA